MRQIALMDLLQGPIVSEKSTRTSEKHKQFAFKVSSAATKGQIKQAVELAFAVEVESVNVLNVKGKAKRFGRHQGRRSNWKKAYVRLRAGSEIDFSGYV